MSKLRAAHGGRAYEARGHFALTWAERIRALLGGEVHVKCTIVVLPGGDLPTSFDKDVSWPWEKR